MIELIVNDFCEDCPEFEPDVEKCVIECGWGNTLKHDTTIKCKHEDRCVNIVKYMVDQARKQKKES